MSPFSRLLKSLRLSRGLKQIDMAIKLGYESSYVSALERSEKGPPRQDFVQRLIRGLELDDSEQEQLAKALADSKRQISLPPKASDAEYQLIRTLGAKLGRLHPMQIQLINLTLHLGDHSSLLGDVCSEKECSSRMG